MPARLIGATDWRWRNVEVWTRIGAHALVSAGLRAPAAAARFRASARLLAIEPLVTDKWWISDRTVEEPNAGRIEREEVRLKQRPGRDFSPE